MLRQGCRRNKNLLWISVSASTMMLLVAACASAPTPKKKNLTQTEKAQLLIEIANNALLEGDSTGALQNLVVAEELDPQNSELHHSKAIAYHAKGQFELALTEAKKAVELAPQAAQFNNTLGKI